MLSREIFRQNFPVEKCDKTLIKLEQIFVMIVSLTDK